MRASILCVTGALVAASGCSHNKETTEQVKQQQPPAAEAETQGGSTSSSTGASGLGAEKSSDSSCPMQVAGTTLRTEDASGGVTMVFMTSGDVTELRSRVRRMADMHNHMQSSSGESGSTEKSRMNSSGATLNPMPGSGPYDTQGSGAPGGGTLGAQDGNNPQSTTMAPRDQHAGMQAGSSMGTMPSSTARAEDIDGGVQLVLIAIDPSQTDALRQNVRQEAQQMASGQCMMDAQGGAQGTMQQQGAPTPNGSENQHEEGYSPTGY